MLDQNVLDTAHLLRRAGFGETPDVIQAAAARGLASVTDDLLHPERTPNPFNDDEVMDALLATIPETRRTDRGGRVYVPLQFVKVWWTMRMLSTPHPLVEKMTLFWHGHFTSKDGNQQGELMMKQNQLFRQNALGNFRDLTLAVARNPEMLRYLNGNQNFKAHANENFGRELMELYTCGIGNYTEHDVKASSRAFTGWNLRRGKFYFNPYQHDNSMKTFMGKTGNWNGNDIIDMLVAHPATARRLCTELFTYFAYPNPEPAVLDALVTTYYDSGYDVRAILSQIFHSHAFYSDKARYAVIKCPVQYVIGSAKMMEIVASLPTSAAQLDPGVQVSTVSDSGDLSADRPLAQRLGSLALLPVAMRTMGQDILEPPSVKGWDGGTMWINTATMLARIDFANSLSLSRAAFNGQFVRATEYVRQMNFNAGQWVDYLANQLGPLQLTPETRATLIDYVNAAGQFSPQNMASVITADTESQGPAQPSESTAPFRPLAKRQTGNPFFGRVGPAGIEGRLRGVIPLMMSTPEYQCC